MKLDGRLAMIAERIPQCEILTDIGTDHAYIPIYAVEKGLCGKAIAADLRKGPLERADSNILRHGMRNRIETRLGNGLEPVLAEECDVVVVAGMGGSLIRDILAAAAEKARKANLLLLQPNNAADVLRQWLYESGFEIAGEALASDAGKLYCLMLANWTGKISVRSKFDYYVGAMLLKSGDPLLYDYLEKKRKELDVVIAGREKARTEKARGSESAGISLISGMTTAECVELRDRLNAFPDADRASESEGIAEKMGKVAENTEKAGNEG